MYPHPDRFCSKVRNSNSSLHKAKMKLPTTDTSTARTLHQQSFIRVLLTVCYRSQEQKHSDKHLSTQRTQHFLVFINMDGNLNSTITQTWPVHLSQHFYNSSSKTFFLISQQFSFNSLPPPSPAPTKMVHFDWPNFPFPPHKIPRQAFLILLTTGPMTLLWKKSVRRTNRCYSYTY